MPITIIPDTGINNIYINAVTGKNIILSGANPRERNVYLSGFDIDSIHNYLKNIQGGTVGEYYHLTSGEYSNLVTGSVVRPSETGIFITQYQTGQFYAASNPSGYISTGNADIRFVNVTGTELISGEKSFFNNIDFRSGVNITGTVSLNMANQAVPLDGQFNWNPDYGTVQIGMNGGDVINPVGFKGFYRVKAANTIRKGKVVMSVGSVGNSEYILAQEAQNIGGSGQLIMGISAEEILQNNFGDVVEFGAVKGINTSLFPQDSILYYDPLTTGGVTTGIPLAPNAKVIVGLNTTSANNGTVFVRVSAGSQLGLTDSNVLFSALQNRDFIFYDHGSDLWINGKINTGDISGLSGFVNKNETGVFYPSSNPSGFITGVDLSNYATIPFTTGISGDLQSQISNLQANTGSYYPSSNPSGYITGVDLSSYATIGFSTGISGSLQTQITNLDANTGSYYLNTNPSGFITGIDLSNYSTIDFSTGISGSLQSQITNLDVNTGSYYLNSNPSGFITGVDLTNYSTIDFSTGISGSLQAQITNLDSNTGLYYLNSNPSGFVTGLVVRPSETGIFYTIDNPSGYITGVDLSNYARINTQNIFSGNQTIQGNLSVTGQISSTGNAAIGGNLIVDTNTLFVNATSNRVGIGTTSPSQTLSVVGDASVSSNFTAGPNVLFVDAANNRVGIGTSSPSEKLHVIGGALMETVSPSITLRSTSLNASNAGTLSFSTMGGSEQFTLTFDAALNRFKVFNGSTAGTEIISIPTATNNVGIGTTSPSEKLSVSGNITATGSLNGSSATIPTFTGNTVFSNNLSVSGNFDALKVAFNDSSVYFQTSADVRNWYVKGNGPIISGVETGPSGVFLSSDGLTAYILGTASDTIRAFPLSVAWDITTQSATQSASLLVSGVDTNPTDIHFSPNGVYMYFVGSTNDRVYRYTLSTPWNLGTATYDGIGASLSITAQEITAVGLTMSPDGTKLYITGSSSQNVHQYNLSIAWDLTSAVYVNSYNVSTYESAPQAVAISNDGLKMYVVGTTNDAIVEYRLSVAWDISTAVYHATGFTGLDSTPTGLFINEATNDVYVIGSGFDLIVQFKSDRQLQLYGNSLITDAQLFVGGRVQFKDSLVVDGTITAVKSGTSTFNGLIANGSFISNSTTTLGNTTIGVTLNLGAAATAATSTKTINIGTGGRFGSFTPITIGSLESANAAAFLNNITVQKGLSSVAPIIVENKIDPINAANTPTGSIPFSDTFTETVDTLLQSHVPNVGGSWTRVQVNSATASFTVEASTDYIKPTTTIADNGVIYVANTALTNPDYEVSIDLVTQVSADNQIWLIARYQDVNNFYAVKWSTTAANCGLYKRVAGTYTLLGSVPNLTPISTATNLSLRIIGNTIAVLNGGIPVIAATDSDISAAGYAGIAGGNIGQLATDNLSATWRLDNFSVRYYAYGNSTFTNGNVGIGTSSPTSKLQVKDGDIEAETIGNGIILKSANGTRYRVTVDNSGALITTALP